MENKISLDEIISQIHRINDEIAKRDAHDGRDLPGQISRVDEGMIYEIYNDILGFDPESTTLQNLDVVLANAERHKDSGLITESEKINTYPFGQKTKEIYPRMLAVCRGNKNIGTVFNAMEKQAERMASEYPDPENDPRVGQGLSIFLLTDKWSPSEFSKVEQKFINYALHNGIWFVFLLVTDYGVTEIPFLPNDRDALIGYRNSEISDGSVLEYEEVLNLQKGYEFAIERNGGTWQRYDVDTYTFDIGGHRWTCDTLTGHREGEIPGAALGRFFNRIRFLANDNGAGLKPAPVVLDAGYYTLRVMGLEISWPNISLENLGDDQIKKIASATIEFLKECKAHEY